MSMPYKGNCEHLKEGYCIVCVSKLLKSNKHLMEGYSTPPINELYQKMGWSIYQYPFDQERVPQDFLTESQKSWVYSGWYTEWPKS